jgi:hypothetical protein
VETETAPGPQRYQDAYEPAPEALFESAALTGQEDELESLRASLDSARKEENNRRSRLEEYIGSLEIE